MNFKKIILCLFVLSVSLKGLTQSDAEQKTIEADTALVNSLIQQSKGYLTDSSSKAISLATQAKALAEKIHYKSGEAYALKNIGITYYYEAKYLEALDHYRQSLKI